MIRAPVRSKNSRRQPLGASFLVRVAPEFQFFSGTLLAPTIAVYVSRQVVSAGIVRIHANILLEQYPQSRTCSRQPYRWGDYSSMAIDPVDDCNFWYAQEYSPANGGFNWATHLFSFKFNACH
jgi:hypothetical protein